MYGSNDDGTWEFVWYIELFAFGILQYTIGDNLFTGVV